MKENLLATYSFPEFYCNQKHGSNIVYIHVHCPLPIREAVWSGPRREILKGGTRLLWGPQRQAEASLKIEDLSSNKTTGKFHKCFISSAAE